MIQTQYGNYVKFVRGTESNWANIADSSKSSDTLYFITDAQGTCKMYLGSKLVSNGALSSATSLSELNDVIIGAGITDQSLLVYNASSKVWENKSILDIFQIIQEDFKGATADSDGISGLVPAPKAGQHELFLRGDGTWTNPVEIVSTHISDIQTILSTLTNNNVDNNLSIREIAQDEAYSAVADLVANAPQEFDTLKEIADWIQKNENVSAAELVTKVSNLEDLIYGTEANEETGAIATLGLQSIVSNMQIDLTELEEVVNGHTDQIATLEEILRWREII